ncbi:hypothetical protein GCK72_010749 [Caenorhabditis remanei]|uniref:Chromo domain-containing protein n=1 Tax=Caenorhabditis remanei TaxID=31234 RepID=A0A6A5H5L7_CAERE|nr:hypothetical protein GCK72_010749 [Caenorhabditis remanei]KAF1762487.1 hypothetical protein GCK72_010749 [Caenorhabditis remanei]
MNRKLQCHTIARKMAKKKPAVEAVDTEQYIVDKIVGNEIRDRAIHYKVKWEGYSAEYDSSEPEWRITAEQKLIDFALTVIVPETYVDTIPTILSQLKSYEYDEEIIQTAIDPLSILALTTVQCGSVKFIDNDSIGSKLFFLEYLRDIKQEYLLHSAVLPSDEVIDQNLKRYSAELMYRLYAFPEHPHIRILIPEDIEKLFYSPPLLSQLLFEPVTVEIYDRKENHLFAPQSTDIGFNKTRPFLHESYLNVKKYYDPRWFEHFFLDRRLLYNGMQRDVSSRDRRFRCSLLLEQELGRGWVLRAGHDVEEEIPLIMMAGVIRPCQEAHRSLCRFGERVAFSSFIEIPGTDSCLDRREFHDFTKYIPHSCNPTCSVRLVKSGNDYPDLVVYSKVKLNEANNHTISLDYYKGFRKEVNRYFHKNKHPEGKVFHLFEKKMDFVQCQCLMGGKCRNVLYVDRSLKAENSNAKKKHKLEDMDPQFQFRGMAVVDDTKRIWEIKNAQFVE